MQNAPANGTVDPKKSKHGFRVLYAGFPFSLGFGVGEHSYSNFLASPVQRKALTWGEIKNMAPRVQSTQIRGILGFWTCKFAGIREFPDPGRCIPVIFLRLRSPLVVGVIKGHGN